MKRSLFVANWKMYLSFDAAVDWCKLCVRDGGMMAREADIIVCPEATYLSLLTKYLEGIVAVGAQECSIYPDGPFTGDISAAHLAQSGIFYTLVGHHERRLYYGETTLKITKKIIVASQNGVEPIICVSDAADAEAIFLAIKNESFLPKSIVCAFEPPASIGTGVVAEFTEIEKISLAIKKSAVSIFPGADVSVLYGGSVDVFSAKMLGNVSSIDGLLIGKAGTDFQAFKKIVSSFMSRVF